MRSKHLAEHGVLLLIWGGLLVLFGVLSENFLTAGTLSALVNRIPALTVVAAGMTLVLITGGIDLSVGSVLGLGGAVLGVAMVDWHWSLLPAAGLCILVALLAGSLNGLISVGLRIPPFIVTLGMLEMVRGLAYLSTRSQTKYIGTAVEGPSSSIPRLGVSAAFLIALALILVGQAVLARTVFGRKLVAIGTNEEAVRLAGINPRTPKILTFVLLGLFTGLAAVFYTSRLGSSDPNAGVGLELSAISAAVIGGTSLLGGRGSVVSSFLGVLIIATLEAGLAQVGASEPLKRIVTGLVIIIAVVLDAWRHYLTGRQYTLFRRMFST